MSSRPTTPPTTLRELLLVRRGLAFVGSHGDAVATEHVRALELELANVGYVLSTRLSSRLARCTLDELAAFRAWALNALLAHAGGAQKHEPLFRSFPRGIPDDTLALWWAKVLVHFVQGEGQPCLFCRRVGSTHVLQPCRHVVCAHCFDGASYSACPACEHHVDRSSPFFAPEPPRAQPAERLVFKLLDLGERVDVEARSLFVSLCERKQALSPLDRDALVTVVGEYKADVLGWLPAKVPVRENVAIVFGTLFKVCEPGLVLPHAERFMTTATDVLRLIAVLSGADGSLVRETVFKTFETTERPSRFWGKVAALFGAEPPEPRATTKTIPLRVARFKVAKLSRALRRALLALLEGMGRERLVEDMLRQRAYWVWVGEFLHPHEYAARFPNVAYAFQIVRTKAPDGTPAPEFRTWSGRLDHAVRARDAEAMLAILAERPGELARRFDHALRVAHDDASRACAIALFVKNVPAFATPVLLTLRSHLPARGAKAAIRVYWPKGRVAKGVSSADERPTLSLPLLEPALRAIDAELLRRFGEKPAFESCLIDAELRAVVAPFNERTASRSAVALPRGSRVRVPESKRARMFLHWCQPQRGGRTTDLDLSVGLYDEAWQPVGVCSFYQLKLEGEGGALVAQSSGDLRDAPWPDGATEFVDLDRMQALAIRARYAVMVVNAYSGMSFSQLERGFAGLMLRDDAEGQHFDPRTVELRFALDGENGVYLPLVFDLREGRLHWLDVSSKGQLDMNSVASSNRAITKICPELITYFASGVRTSMFDLAALHAAARCERVFVRGETIAEYVRRPGETKAAFLARLVRDEPDEPRARGPRADGPPIMAVLYRGDVELPEDSPVYALFRERVVPSLAASDLIA